MENILTTGSYSNVSLSHPAFVVDVHEQNHRDDDKLFFPSLRRTRVLSQAGGGVSPLVWQGPHHKDET